MHSLCRQCKEAWFAHAPGIFIFDVLILLLLLLEALFVLPNKWVMAIQYKTEVVGTDSTSPSAEEEIDFSNIRYETKTETIPLELWEASNNVLFIVPLNTFLIAMTFRIFFCKMNIWIIKTFLFLLIFGIYVSDSVAIVMYS